MSFGKVVHHSTYTLNKSALKSVTEHKDVGVLLTSKLSFSKHLKNILAKAHRSLGLLRRVIPSSSSITLKRSLYLSLVRSHLVHCSQIWRPFMIQDSKLLESLQRKASKFILNDYQTDYKSRLQQLKLLPLTLWLEIQDILFFITLIKFPPDNFNLKNYIQFITSASRSATSHKIRPVITRSPRLNITKFFYFNRIVRIWNSLPPVDLSLSFNSLRKSIYDLHWDYFSSNYDPGDPCSWSRTCLCTRCTS